MLKFLIILLIFGLANGNQRIAGGWTANRGDFPYHAHIQSNFYLKQEKIKILISMIFF